MLGHETRALDNRSTRAVDGALEERRHDGEHDPASLPTVNGVVLEALGDAYSGLADGDRVVVGASGAVVTNGENIVGDGPGLENYAFCTAPHSSALLPPGVYTVKKIS